MALADGPLKVTRVAGFSGSVFFVCRTAAKVPDVFCFMGSGLCFHMFSPVYSWVDHVKTCENHLQRLVGWFGLVDHVKGEG